jgi:hypothetical protein
MFIRQTDTADVRSDRAENDNLSGSSVGVDTLNLNEGSFPFFPTKEFRYQMVLAWQQRMHPSSQEWSRERGVTKWIPFAAICNARGEKKLLNDKGKMLSLPAKEVHVNDLVVETLIRRYTKAADKSDDPWNSWRAKFELKCFSLLHTVTGTDEEHKDIAV